MCYGPWRSTDLQWAIPDLKCPPPVEDVKACCKTYLEIQTTKLCHSVEIQTTFVKSIWKSWKLCQKKIWNLVKLYQIYLEMLTKTVKIFWNLILLLIKSGNIFMQRLHSFQWDSVLHIFAVSMNFTGAISLKIEDQTIWTMGLNMKQKTHEKCEHVGAYL